MLSREQILERANNFTDRPLAIEAFWDGDTSGWFIVLSAIYQKVINGRLVYKDSDLAVLQGKTGDLRLFNRQVPPWQEAIFASEVGTEIATQLGIPFYFASPNHPEDNCPRWWERHLAHPCRRCGIDLLELEICYECRLDEEREARKSADGQQKGNN